MKRIYSLAIAIVLSMLTATAFSEIEDVITVIGSRTERSINDLSATVDVIKAERIEEELARDIADLVRFEPGVSVAGTGSRFGLTGFNIRGIGGNRVLTLVDGIRLSDEFSFGPFLSARRDFVDIDSLSRAEIARGPISSLWGSDALGGVVSFTTKSPDEFLDEDDNFYSSLKIGYSSADSSALATATLVGGNETLSGLLIYTKRDGEETENAGEQGGFGPTREKPDAQDIESDNVVAKISWQPLDGHELSISVDYFDNQTDSNLFSDYGIVSRGTLINSRDAYDERERTRIALSYSIEQDILIADEAKATIYKQESETTQLLLESRTPPPFLFTQSRNRLSVFEQEIEGATIQFTKFFDIGDTGHTLTYGLDYYETSNESLRDGGTQDAAGNPVFEFSPLPTRDFPKTDVENFAIFIQDEIELLDGRLLLSPGLRYDDFEANATADVLYFSGNPGVGVPSDFEDSEVTGKIGALYRLNEGISAFIRFSEGFRAPPYDDVNLGFTNFMGGYKTISAPGLTSETSSSWEVGIRTKGEFITASFTVFKNDYEDFIASAGDGHCPTQYQRFGCFDPVDGFLVFQSENLSEVEIEGAELKVDYNLSVLGLDNFGLRAAVAYADGEDVDTNEPINSIEPLSAVLGLQFDSPSGRWGGDLVWTVVKEKKNSDISSGSFLYATSGYGILDLMGYFNVNDSISINFGVYNITDKEYIRWTDSAGIGADAPSRFTQPGLNTSVSLQFEF